MLLMLQLVSTVVLALAFVQQSASNLSKEDLPNRLKESSFARATLFFFTAVILSLIQDDNIGILSDTNKPSSG